MENVSITIDHKGVKFKILSNHLRSPPYWVYDQMNLLRNGDTQVDKKTCCGISNSSKNAIQEKRQVPRLLRKGLWSLIKARQPTEKNRHTVVLLGTTVRKRTRDMDTI
jgi:hypothetical protein